jgi:hypothetical protein
VETPTTQPATAANPVNKLTPTVTVTPATTTAARASALKVTVKVAASAGTPTGAVILSGGGFTSASTALVNGIATITIPAGRLAVAKDTLTAAYAGDASDLAAHGSSTVTVIKLTPTVTVTPAVATVARASALAVTVKVAATAGTPTGTVTLSGGGFTSVATALVGGLAHITIPAGRLTVGMDTLTATYTGDADDLAAHGSAAVTVVKVTPTVTVTPAVTTVVETNSLAVTIKVAATAGVPSGTVTLAGGGYASAATTLVSGVAKVTIPANKLTTGAVTLTATYSGDGNDNAASGHEAITVNK